MKYSTILIFLLFARVATAQHIKNMCKQFEVDIENSGLFANELEIVKDSMSKRIDLIFEQRFDDSVIVLCDEKIVFNGKLKTISTLGACVDMVQINYNKNKKLPKVSIVLPLKGNCIFFYPVKGKQIAYINYLDGAWGVELSNVVREYR